MTGTHKETGTQNQAETQAEKQRETQRDIKRERHTPVLSCSTTVHGHRERRRQNVLHTLLFSLLLTLLPSSR